jgi:hypothetical protein
VGKAAQRTQELHIRRTCSADRSASAAILRRGSPSSRAARMASLCLERASQSASVVSTTRLSAAWCSVAGRTVTKCDIIRKDRPRSSGPVAPGDPIRPPPRRRQHQQSDRQADPLRPDPDRRRRPAPGLRRRGRGALPRRRRCLRETVDRTLIKHPPLRVRRADAKDARHRHRRPATAPRPRADHRRAGQLPARASDRRQGGDAPDLTPAAPPGGEI